MRFVRLNVFDHATILEGGAQIVTGGCPAFLTATAALILICMKDFKLCKVFKALASRKKIALSCQWRLIAARKKDLCNAVNEGLWKVMGLRTSTLKYFVT